MEEKSRLNTGKRTAKLKNTAYHKNSQKYSQTKYLRKKLFNDCEKTEGKATEARRDRRYI